MKYVLLFCLLATPAFAQYDDPYGTGTQANSRYIEQQNEQQQIANQNWQMQDQIRQQNERIEQQQNQINSQQSRGWQPMGGVDLRGPDLR